MHEEVSSWINPDDIVELYGFPSLERWGIKTTGDLLKYHIHEYKTLGIPKDTLARVVYLLKVHGIKI